MKKTLIIICLTVFAQGFAQKYYTKTGNIHFEASVPAFEPVEADHKTVTAIFNTDSGELAVLALVKGFRFRNALMEEHFNENYMESDTYPKAVFKGSIDGFSKDALKQGGTMKVQGTLMLHGKTKDIATTLTISPKKDGLSLETSFTVTPEEFDIEIPGIVSEKISDKILIDVNLELIQK